MYNVQIDRLKDNMLSLVLKQMRPYVKQENYEIQQRYDNIVMLCKQCFLYEDHSMMENLKAMVYELNDDLKEGYGIREHRRYEYIVRENSHISDDVLLLTLSKKFDTSSINANLDAELIVLFRQIWLSGKTSPAVVTALNEFIARSSSFVVTFIVYAIMLRCVRYYDRAMVRLLMEIRTPEAFVALAVVMMCHFTRIVYDKSQRDVFAAFFTDSFCGSRLSKSLGLLCRTNETKVIAEEFEKTIYPEVIKKRSDLNIDSILEKGKNPDWESLLEGSPLMDKMRKINDMQLKGKDVNFATFKAMKGYPFFSDTAHWFFPFTFQYYEFNSVKCMNEKDIALLSRVANICDSDRYSLFLMFRSMGIANLETALGSMGVNQMNDLQDMVDDNLKNTDEVQFALRMRYAVMNIFRFYNLAPNHTDFTSPFSVALTEESVESLKSLLPIETLAIMANAAFFAKDYRNALPLYANSVNEVIDTDVHIFQKIGYCCEQMQKYQSAIEMYDKSDVLLPDDVWTLRRLLACHSAIDGHCAICIRINRRLMNLVPDDNDVVMSLAGQLCENHLFTEAIPLLFKLEYASPSFKIWEMLARALSLTGKYEDAGKYFKKACDSQEAEPQTFVNAAMNDKFLMGEECDTFLNQAYGIINDIEKFLQLFEAGYVVEMMAQLTNEQRDNISNTINKIIIES